MKLRVTGSKPILKTYPFTVEQLEIAKDGKPVADPFYRLRCPDWVNMMALTSNGDAVMIRQARVGTESLVLETPGGAIDENEKDPMLAAVRELEEETGYTTQRVLPLAVINPNPAIMTNKVHLFVGLDCQPVQTRKHFPDALEDIRVELIKTSELEHLVRTNQLNHALSALCVLMAAKYFSAKSS
jgi:8-oxo-dGTP pyrophosphatase MutT (NUDIX family)